MKLTVPPPEFNWSGGKDLSAAFITDGMMKLIPKRLIIEKIATSQNGVFASAVPSNAVPRKKKNKPDHDRILRFEMVGEAAGKRECKGDDQPGRHHEHTGIGRGKILHQLAEDRHGVGGREIAHAEDKGDQAGGGESRYAEKREIQQRVLRLGLRPQKSRSPPPPPPLNKPGDVIRGPAKFLAVREGVDQAKQRNAQEEVARPIEFRAVGPADRRHEDETQGEGDDDQGKRYVEICNAS